ncbi:MAG: DegT/DnrJ/EryC1/StrS family aminotransferase, partial [Patescibacteria group bacterium]
MIPVNQPAIAKNALRYVTDCVRSGWVSSAGSYIAKFEKSSAQYLHTRYAITTTSGTAALHLALAALDVSPKDEVILPAHTMFACAAAILYTGATPVLVDVERDTWNMQVQEVEKKITKRTKVIMPVHIYGHPVDMDPLQALAKKHGIAIVEDTAEAHGATYKGKKVGTIGDINCFSFYANKIVTTGEGGMVVTNNKKLADRARMLKDMAHSPTRRFLHKDLGFNYRMTNMQAALGLAQLEEIDSFISKKRWMANLYTELLSTVPGITSPIERPWAKSVYWMYAILIEDAFGMNRDELAAKLKARGIDTRTFFISLHRQPVLTKRGLFRREEHDYPVTDEISERGMYL